MRDFDNDNFEGTTQHSESWVAEGDSTEEVCTKLAQALGTGVDGTVIKVRKGSRVVYGLLGASATPRRLLPVKLWVTTQVDSAGHIRVSVTAKSGGAERGIDCVVRGPKRFATAFEVWLSKMREEVPPIAVEGPQ